MQSSPKDGSIEQSGKDVCVPFPFSFHTINNLRSKFELGQQTVEYHGLMAINKPNIIRQSVYWWCHKSWCSQFDSNFKYKSLPSSR